MKTKMKMVMAFIAFALCASLWAGSATWNFRSGVGTSPEDPALWNDSDNWVGGSPASGTTATATFTGAGTTNDFVWVKLPDDEYVDLCHIAHTDLSTSARFRFIGGKGFRFFRYDNSGTNARAYIEATGYENGVIDSYWSPITVDKGCFLDVRGSNLACPMTFGRTERTEGRQLNLAYPQACYRCEWYAPCGGETRSCIPALKYLHLGHYASFGTPQNNDAHVGHWTATSGSKLLKYVSGKKGTELAVGQYVHATGIIPEGAYVERIYTDDYIEISEAAQDSSVDVAVSFDRCYYKLTQHLDVLSTSGDNASLSFVERRSSENVATLEIDELEGRTDANDRLLFHQLGHKYYTSQFRETDMEDYPLPGVVELPDLSAINGFVGGRSGWVRFTSSTPGGADVKKYQFYDNASYRQNGFYVFDTPEGISSTVTCSNQWYGSIGKRGPGEMTVRTSIAGHKCLRVYEGLFTLDPSAEGSTMEKVTVKAGGAFRLAPGRSLTVSTLVVENGGRVSLVAGATLEPTAVTFEAGGIIRVDVVSVIMRLSAEPVTVTETPPWNSHALYLRVQQQRIDEAVAVAATSRAEAEAQLKIAIAKGDATAEAEARKIIAAAEAEEIRLKGLAEAEALRAKGGDYQAETARIVGQAAAENESGGAVNGGGMASEIIKAGIGVGLGIQIIKTVTTALGDILVYSDGTWECPKCHHKGNKGKFCESCGMENPEFAEKWDCPECGAKGLTSNFCPNCGHKKGE